LANNPNNNLNRDLNRDRSSDLDLNVRIVLVEPAGELNLGSVARVMKNMGLSQLWLVNPLADRQSEAAQNMAVHAKDILRGAQVVDSLPAALAGCQRAIATVGRIDFTDEMIAAAKGVSSGLRWLTNAATSAIVFGPEDRGLSNHEIAYCQQILTIPTSNSYPSLNLAQAVGICCYQLRALAIANAIQPPQINRNKVEQPSAPIINPNLLGALPLAQANKGKQKSSDAAQLGTNPTETELAPSHSIPELDPDPNPTCPPQAQIPAPTIELKPSLPNRENNYAPNLATGTSQNDKDLLDSASIDAIEAYYQQLEIVLLQIGFLYPHTSFSRMKKLRRIFNKADLTKAEVNMLRGMLSQMAWAAAQGDRHA
jgi:tRNA/rRNA methyltransferase